MIQSTGNGKSLCFQYPPVYLRKKAVVIMPTISLMRDQTIQVNEFGIKVAYMVSAAKYEAATIAALNPTSDVKIIFVTPEWLFTGRLNNINKLSTLEKGDQLCLIAIDEAHLIYEWHSFRPGLKPGRVIRVTRVTFSPGHPGLTRFIKYPGLTRIDCTIRVFRSFGAWITHS